MSYLNDQIVEKLRTPEYFDEGIAELEAQFQQMAEKIEALTNNLHGVERPLQEEIDRLQAREKEAVALIEPLGMWSRMFSQ